MKLLFNHNNQGQTELKATLGFLDGDFNYLNLEPDILLNTPMLVDFIGQSVYDKIADYYDTTTPAPTGDELTYHKNCLKFMQIYIASMAYLDYAPNNDLTHSNAGRTVVVDDNAKMPWDWQVNNDAAAIKKRAYKALDLLFVELDKTSWTEWTGSDAYKKAKSLFVSSTKKFDDIYNINKSGQLYFRLVPFMDDFETGAITAILKESTVTDLKEAGSPTEAQQDLIKLSSKAVVYLSLAKGLQVLPVQMFPDGVVYREDTRSKSMVRAEVVQFLQNEADRYLKLLEHEYNLQNATFEEANPTPGLEDGKKYVNL